jgi:hypothetical protein
MASGVNIGGFGIGCPIAHFKCFPVPSPRFEQFVLGSSSVGLSLARIVVQDYPKFFTSLMEFFRYWRDIAISQAIGSLRDNVV